MKWLLDSDRSIRLGVMRDPTQELRQTTALKSPRKGLRIIGRLAMFGRLLLAGSMFAMTQMAGAAPIVSGAYYEDNVESPATCGTNICGVTFSPIPAGKAVLITHVSCHIQIGHDKTLSLAELVLIPASSTTPVSRRETLPVGPVRALGSIDYYTAAGDVSFKYAPGTKPAVFAYSFNTNFFLRCRITGQRPAPF